MHKWAFLHIKNGGWAHFPVSKCGEVFWEGLHTCSILSAERYLFTTVHTPTYSSLSEMNYPACFHRMIKTPDDSVDVGSVPIAVDCDIWEHEGKLISD